MTAELSMPPHKHKILVIEDDHTMSELVCHHLHSQGYYTRQCYDGASGLKYALQESFSLILLDVMLPKLDGLEVLKRVRLITNTPILMLTAKGAEQDRLLGFRTGADDYLPKPFNIEELSLRIEAILRRTTQTSSLTAHKETKIFFEDLTLDTENSTASFQDKPIPFTNTEFKLLAILLINRNKVLSKPYLYQEVMQRPYSREERSLDMHISKIRRKLASVNFNTYHLNTVHGQGYCIK